MKRSLILAATVGLLLAVPAMADLGQAILTFPGYVTDGTIGVYGDGYASGATGYGGIYMIKISNATGDATLVRNKVTGWNSSYNGAFAAFCIELPQSTAGGTLHSVQLPQDAPIPPAFGTPMGAQKAAYLSELWGLYFDPAWVTGTPTLAEQRAAEAFSAAVWEIVYEPYEADPDDYDVTTAQNGTTGNKFFRVNPTTVDWSTANTWLRSLDDVAGPMAELRAFTNANGQDMLVETPAPGAALLGVIGLGLVGWVKRRFA